MTPNTRSTEVDCRTMAERRVPARPARGKAPAAPRRCRRPRPSRRRRRRPRRRRRRRPPRPRRRPPRSAGEEGHLDAQVEPREAYGAAGGPGRGADVISIRGAREHNLRDVDIDLPRDQLVVLTGLSGSGKSSLAFDTIYAEGQRRYVESLSSYARQFLGQMDKPDVDFIEGLSPAISIDQKSGEPQPALDRRHDHRDLRLPAPALRAHRHPALPEVRPGHHPPDAAADRRPRAAAARGHPVPGARTGRAGPQGRVRGHARRARRSRASPGPASTARSSSSSDRRARTRLARYENHTIEVVVDRLVRRSGIERRLTDSLETALRLAEGVAEVEIVPKDGDGTEPEILTFSEHLACTYDGLSFDELAPRNFSFNSPYGACERCDGLGTRFEVDPELIVGDDDLSIREGAIAPWSGYRGEYFNRVLDAVGDEYGFSVDDAVEEADEGAAEGRAVRRGQVPGARPLQEPVRAQARVHAPATRASSRGSSAGTPRRTATAAASRSRATCARCRAPRATARACGPRPSASRSRTRTSPRSATSRSARPRRSSPRSS